MAILVFSPVSARVADRYGPKVSLVVGAAVMAVGHLSGVFLLSVFLLTELWQLMLVSVVVGTGTGVVCSALPGVVMSAVPTGETAAANGVNALMRSIGMSSAGAVVGAVLGQLSTTFGDRQVPAVEAFRLTFGIAAAAALVGALVAVLIPRRANPDPPGHPVRASGTSTPAGRR